MNAYGAGLSSPRKPLLTWLAKVAGPGVIVIALTACGDDPAAAAPPPLGVASMSMEAGDHQVGEVGTVLAQPIVVRLTDAIGAPVAGHTVRFVGTSGGLVFYTQSNALGLAMAFWQLAERAGPQTVQVSLEEHFVLPVTFNAVGLAGPPSNISAPPVSDAVAVMGTEIDTLTVIVSDRFANAVVNSPFSWSVVSGGGSIRPLATTTDGLGRARAVWTLGPAAGAQRVIVTAGAASRAVNATAVPALVARQVVAGSDHSCALVDDGTALCWGTNWSGQLGTGQSDRNPHRVPEAVGGGLKFKSLAAGAIHTCGLTDDGTTWCWGSNHAGQLGIDATGGAVTPTRVSAAPAFSELVAGAAHTCGLTSTGAVYCWGDNSLGQLGSGANRSTPVPYFGFPQPTPTRVAGSLTFRSITAAWGITCGATTGGIAYCWGGDVERSLGTEGSETCRFIGDDYYGESSFELPCSTTPQYVLTNTAVSSVVSRQDGACAVLATEELVCWGFRSGPTVVPGARVTRAWSLGWTVCGVEVLGTVSCWRSSAPFSAEQPFGQGLTLVDLHSSGRHHCGLERVARTAYCWGSNFDGALGDGTTLHRNLPVPVAASMAARVP